jgi:hypothetical protein
MERGLIGCKFSNNQIKSSHYLERFRVHDEVIQSVVPVAHCWTKWPCIIRGDMGLEPADEPEGFGHRTAGGYGGLVLLNPTPDLAQAIQRGDLSSEGRENRSSNDVTSCL